MAEDALVAHYLSLKPWRFVEVEQFELRFPANPAEAELRSILTIVLRSNEREPGWEPGMPNLALNFYGVVQLRMEMSGY
jgi:hypothetical protein